MFKFGNFFSLHFTAFGLNTEIYGFKVSPSPEKCGPEKFSISTFSRGA